MLTAEKIVPAESSVDPILFFKWLDDNCDKYGNGINNAMNLLVWFCRRVALPIIN